ncbi:MAG: hypothetical protein IBX47_04875 [Desulfuromonadales bacterium]|nr:hypothetical protein [Desulfuromonadales bacterium]
MFQNFLVTLTAALLFFSSGANAASENMVDFNLSLAGYHIGMTYDEAAAVRPFHYLQNSTSPGSSAFKAFVEDLTLNDIEMNLRIDFDAGEITRIVARFPPDKMPEMLQFMQSAQGIGENRSKELSRYDDEEIHQTIYLWDYPQAKMHLISISSVTEFATASLITKKSATDIVTPEN